MADPPESAAIYFSKFDDRACFLDFVSQFLQAVDKTDWLRNVPSKTYMKPNLFTIPHIQGAVEVYSTIIESVKATKASQEQL